MNAIKTLQANLGPLFTPTRAQRKANSSFGRGTPVYTCRLCKRDTRKGAGDGADVALCDQCYDLAELDNTIQDAGLTPARAAERTALRSAVLARGGKAWWPLDPSEAHTDSAAARAHAEAIHKVAVRPAAAARAKAAPTRGVRKSPAVVHAQAAFNLANEHLHAAAANQSGHERRFAELVSKYGKLPRARAARAEWDAVSAALQASKETYAAALEAVHTAQAAWRAAEAAPVRKPKAPAQAKLAPKAQPKAPKAPKVGTLTPGQHTFLSALAALGTAGMDAATVYPKTYERCLFLSLEKRGLVQLVGSTKAGICSVTPKGTELLGNIAALQG